MSGIVPPQAGGQQSADPQPQPMGTPIAQDRASYQAVQPQQVAPQKPAYSFNTLEEAVAFAEAQLEKKRAANQEAKEARTELAALKQQVEFLVAQQRLAQQQAIAVNVQLQAKNLGFRNPAFVYGAIASQLQYDQATGQPTNVAAVLEALKTSDPYLLEAPPAAQGQPQGQPAQPGQQQPPQGQPGQPPQAPQPGQPAAQPPRTGVMNTAQSGTSVGSGLTWEVIHANIKNPSWVAANESQLEAFMADPANYVGRQR